MKFIRQFKVGDKVKWASQAAGSWVVKVGTIIEVVPALQFPKTHRTAACRRAESYVVEATPVKRGRGLGPWRIYWPNATALRAWSGSTAPAALRVTR